MTVGAPGDALAQPVAASLRRGDIALLLLPVDGGVVAARDAVRRMCAELLTGLRAGHRLAPQVSRSATPGLAALALTLSGPVGVDIERWRPELVDADLLNLALHADERRDGARAAAAGFFAVWTRKEAVLKALGVGLALAPASFHAGPPTADWHRVRTAAGPATVRNVTIPVDTDGGPTRYAAALAIVTAAAAPAAVRTFRLAA